MAGQQIGVGAHQFDKQHLAAYRGKVADDKACAALTKAVAKIERAGFPIEGEHYKKLPRGFEPISPKRDKLLRHAALWSGRDEPLPKALYSKAFVGFCVDRWKKLAPLHRWLVDELQ